MTRETLYERLGSFGVDTAFIKKLNFTDDELAAFVDKLAEVMKNHRP
ncbi:hypothetical protein NTE_02957 [Candidatus Nitrososphaera evergladensis SR1]|uniref:Uncharacterized protein n=1 Tax=Candidatus Nitrososphaera evergladensis SR1 TaxID=1459636 RepID=A0A075MWG2_9ARCH|nr:hypothetical protein [Candidatus Nitrososphaera evergladensis]AIF84992.1 hypothetical protein NTE_02957 [Candidatus Nitrososphaera evergladensis SR1]